MILDGIELPVCCGEGFRIYPYNGDVIITCDGTPKFTGTNITRFNKCNKSKTLNNLKDGILWEDCDYCGGDLYEETKKSTSELPDDEEDLTVCEDCWEKHYTESLGAESKKTEDDDDYLPDFLKEDSVVESPFGLDDMVMPSDYEWNYLIDDYSVEGIKKARLGSLFIKLTGNQRRTLDKIRAKLYNWDSEPSYSDIFHKEFCKTEGVSLSVLKTLEKKGLIKLSKDDYYFKERGYIVYPKPMMYAFYITNEEDYPDWFIPEAKEKGLWKAESKKMNPLEKEGISGMASGATMEGLETLMAAEGQGFEYYFLVDDDGKVTNDFSSLEEAQIARSYVPHKNLKIMRRRFEGRNMTGKTTEVREFDPYSVPNYFKNNYHSEEEELSKEQLSAYFARLKNQNPDLAKEIEYSVKEQSYLPRVDINKAGFDDDIIEAWVDLVAVEDDKYAPFERCDECEGEGYVLTSYTSATRFEPADGDGEDCSYCEGTGEIDPAEYMYSNDDGKVGYLAETFEAPMKGAQPRRGRYEVALPLDKTHTSAIRKALKDNYKGFNFSVKMNGNTTVVINLKSGKQEIDDWDSMENGIIDLAIDTIWDMEKGDEHYVYFDTKDEMGIDVYCFLGAFGNKEYIVKNAETKLSKTSCCCGADEANPCVCMKAPEPMECSAKAPKCACYKALEKNAEFLYYYVLNEKGESPADFNTLEEAQTYVANSSEPLEIYERRSRDDEAYKMDKKMNAEYDEEDMVFCNHCSDIVGNEKEVYGDETVEYEMANGELVCIPCHKIWMKEYKNDLDPHYSPFYAESFIKSHYVWGVGIFALTLGLLSRKR